MSKNQLSDEELQKDVDAYIATGGNRSEAARLRNLPRMTFNDRLKIAEKRLGIVLGKMADGRIEQVEHERLPLPSPGNVKRYILTSAQNNTYLHPGWINLKAYADWLDQFGDGCEFMVGTFSYALDAYGAKAVKRGSWKPQDSLWYAPEIMEYVRDSRVELAPGLIWCGEMNILPTAQNPLNGLETYNGRASNIVPHAKVAMESVPSLPDEATKFNFSTGTITQRNYIQKRAGIVAEPKHAYAGLLVEVNSDGNWWVRQLHIDGNGHVYDVGPSERGEKSGPVKVVDGQVLDDLPHLVDSIVWGDIHASEMEDWVRRLGWGKGGMLDTLAPRRQFWHDLFSMRSRGHHEMKDFHRTFEKMVAGQDSVEGEVGVTASFVNFANRDWCQAIVVPSNHDRHLDRWLNEEDPRKDPKNAPYHLRLQAAKLQAISDGDRTFNVLEWALRAKGIPEAVMFLAEDESYVICRDTIDGGIECGMHGDRGPGGSRGSTRGLRRLGRSVIKGHDHTAAIVENIYSVGACSLSFPYMKGPSAHSVSHCVVFENGRRQIITMWNGRWRA